MYAVGFLVYGGQYLFADPFGFKLQAYSYDAATNSFSWKDLKSTMDSQGILGLTNVNTIQANITASSQQRSSIVSNPVGTAGSIASETFLLATGLTVFNLLLILGVPSIIVAPLIVLYGFLVARTIIGYIRGI